MTNERILMNAASEYGTPTFLFDIDELINRVTSIRKILDNATETLNDGTCKKIKLTYSIKANPFLIPYINDYIDMFEVCSPGELEIIKNYNIPGDKIIYSGVNKGLQDTADAIAYGSAIITAESKQHFKLIKTAVAKETNGKVHVILRMTSGNQFGMSFEDICDILEEYISAKGSEWAKNIAIDGIHYFAGTQRNNPKPQAKELDKITETINKLRNKFHLKLPKLEYGPGLPYPYFEKEDFSDTLAPLKNIAEHLAKMTDTADLTIEMGRFIASSCGCYLSSIADLKCSGNMNWCIIDGGMNHINYYGQMMGMKRPVIRFFDGLTKEVKATDPVDSHIQTATDEYVKCMYALCGSLCTANDILYREMPLQNPQIGDILVFENLGAYSVTEGINLFLSRNMAKIAIVKDGKLELLRDTVNSWKINCVRE